MSTSKLEILFSCWTSLSWLRAYEQSHRQFDRHCVSLETNKANLKVIVFFLNQSSVCCWLTPIHTSENNFVLLVLTTNAFIPQSRSFRTTPWCKQTSFPVQPSSTRHFIGSREYLSPITLLCRETWPLCEERMASGMDGFAGRLRVLELYSGIGGMHWALKGVYHATE